MDVGSMRGTPTGVCDPFGGSRMNRPGLLTVLVVALALPCAVYGEGDEYVDMLKEKVPGYERHITGQFAPMWEPLAR